MTNMRPETNRSDVKEQRGIICPKCGCQDFRVVYTRPGWGSRIIRRRECRNCGKRLTTYERAA